MRSGSIPTGGELAGLLVYNGLLDCTHTDNMTSMESTPGGLVTVKSH